LDDPHDQRMTARAGLRSALVVALVVSMTPAVARADHFRLASDLRPLPGSDPGIQYSSDLVAASPDGTFAFTAGEVLYWFAAGRIVRWTRMPGVKDIQYEGDGSLLVVQGRETMGGRDHAVLWRYTPSGARVRVAGVVDKEGFAGDGGPATDALLACPQAVASDARGILLADGCNGSRIRRIAPDGTIATIAGTGEQGPSGDGGPATSAAFYARSIASLPDGSIAFVDIVLTSSISWRIRVIDAAGIIRTLVDNVNGGRVRTGPDNTILYVGASYRSVEVLHRDGSHEPLFLWRADAGIAPDLDVAGDPFGNRPEAQDAAVAPDGGFLVTGDFDVLYLPPAQPRVLAVAIRPRTRLPRRALRAAIRLTLPADVEASLWRGHHQVATARASAPAGDSTLVVGGRVQPGEYSLRVRATASGQSIVARANVLVGGVLPVSWVRRFVRSREELFRIFNDAPRSRVTCRRGGRLRVDCGIVQRGRCAAVVVVRQRPDGTLVAYQ
jgi:hypothetical protein